MTQPAKSHEPSMEEILASIRRIIADDDAKPDSAAPAQPAPVIERPKAPPPAVNGAAKPAAASTARSTVPPLVKPVEPKPAAPAVSNSQDDIDALLAGFDAPGDSGTPKAASSPQDDVLELTEQMEVGPKEQPGFHNADVNDDIEFAEAAPMPDPASPPRTTPPPPSFVASEPTPAQRPLMSSSTATAVNSAFNALAQTVLSNNARTLEDLVKEMLRPMLQSWLDDNLPGLVEKIVRAEIERVSRGR